MATFCRDCLADSPPDRAACEACGSARLVSHPELTELAIAHVDCDAFYAAVEKRDNPALQDKAVIVGGRSRRGVVLTCCYNARKFGVRSAMPMFQAMQLCPHATVVPPDMDKYAAVAREVRALLRALTPMVEPVSLDEAYLDLAGTERLHKRSPAKTMANVATEIERTIGITVSVGLSHNKFLAKLASDLMKPRGFAVIGRAETKQFLKDKPVWMIRGCGPVLQKRLAADGITRIGQLQDLGEHRLVSRYGDTGRWLYRLAIGEDSRVIEADGESKSISSETTFEFDIASLDDLERILWEQCEHLSARIKAAGVGGRTVVLKLKTAAFRIRTRSATLDNPTQLSDVLFRVGRTLLAREADGTRYRLLGIGLSKIEPADKCDPPNLLDERAMRRAATERAIDSVRAKFGEVALRRGRSLKS
jgi:DNA polymerase IV